MDSKSPPKGARLGSLDPLMHAHCGKFCHSTPLSEINNAVDDDMHAIAPTTIDTGDAIH